MPAPPSSRRLISVHPDLVFLAAALGVVALMVVLLRPTRPAVESPLPAQNEVVLPSSELIRINARLVRRDATNEPFTGWMTEAYPDGSPKSRSQISNGVLHGHSEGFHTNGVLQIRESFDHGVSEGPVMKWYPDGVHLSEGTARQGRLEGTFRRWHPNGQLAEEMVLVGGIPDGLSRAWFPSGSLKAEVELSHGKVVKQQFWEDGQKPPVAPNANPNPSP